MSRRVKIRAALAAAALLAQLALPFVHGAGLAEGLPLWPDGRATAFSTPSDPPAAAPHDSILCPTCTALHQVRSGIARTPAADAPRPSGAQIEHGREPAYTLPRTPDLAAAAPRGPPIRPLAFA
jgi:hypothetical protein